MALAYDTCFGGWSKTYSTQALLRRDWSWIGRVDGLWPLTATAPSDFAKSRFHCSIVQVQEAIGVALARKMEAEQQSANFIKESEEIRRLEKSIRLKHKHPTKVGSDNSARSPLVIKHLNETIDLKKKKKTIILTVKQSQGRTVRI